MKISKYQETAALAAIEKEYKRLDQLIGVSVSSIPVSLSSRLTRKLGYFQIKKEGLFSRPKLSIVIATDALHTEELFYDVIRHEYAHAALYLMDPKSKHGHDKVWKELCRLIGCRPEATQKELPYERPHRPAKYKVICMTCGTSSNYTRESKLVQMAESKIPGTLTCKKCHGHSFRVEKL